ncbi:MAG: peptidylprolyl isomerase [Thioalkalivibrionaceae bacterium]
MTVHDQQTPTTARVVSNIHAIQAFSADHSVSDSRPTSPASRAKTRRSRLARVLTFAFIASIFTVAGCTNDSQTANQAELDRPSTTASGDRVGTIDGYVIDDAFIEAYARATGSPVQNAASRSREELIQIAILANAGREAGLDDDARVRGEVRFRESLAVASRYIEQFEETLEISEDDLRAEYDRQIAGFSAAEYRARHILVEEKDAAEELIDALNGGGDFAELAQANSLDGSAERGGDLGWFTLDRMVPEFSEALAELEPGQYTEAPVQSRFGWHVIQLDEMRDREPPTFEELRPGLRDQFVAEALNAHVNELQSKADIDWPNR